MVHSSLSIINKHVQNHVDIFTWIDFSFRSGIDVNALCMSEALNIGINVKVPFKRSL